MNNKMMILLMSCNEPLYEEEERACRETFLKDADEAGVPYYFYKGTEGEQIIDNEEHTMYLHVPDSLGGTGLKTIAALVEALKMDGWDYLVKTNVSTWLDVPRIAETLSGMEGPDDRNIYGARFLVNNVSKHIPFPRGHFAVYSRSMVSGMTAIVPHIAGAEGFPRTDDTLLGLASLYYVKKTLNDDYVSRLMLLPAINEWTDPITADPSLGRTLCVRCKGGPSGTTTPDNMRAVQTAVRGTREPFKAVPKMAEVYETPYGFQRYEAYGTLRDSIDLLKAVLEKEREEGLSPEIKERVERLTRILKKGQK